MLRITGGIYRGSLLHCPRNIRPTSGRVKEYIFSQVGQYTAEARVLDLFAGSGALGIEALSRKAKEAVFVDSSRNAVIALKKNLMKLNIEAKIIRSDVLKFIKNYRGKPFDLIFVDPPYNEFNPDSVLKLIEDNNCLCEGGFLIFEIPSGTPEPLSNGLLQISFRTLSDTSIGIWFKEG